MRRTQNLKKSPTGFDKTAVFYSVASKQVGDFFNFLWPFQKSWTLPLLVPDNKNALNRSAWFPFRKVGPISEGIFNFVPSSNNGILFPKLL